MWAKSVESDNLSIHTATLRWMSVHPAPPLRLVCPRRGLTILLQSITSAMFEISALVRYETVYDAAP